MGLFFHNAFSLYIHIPYCSSKCSYCDFFSLPSAGIPEHYVEALLNQLDFLVRLGLVGQLETIYFGGGTPSLLSCSQLSRILEKICPLMADGAEVTLEVNPESLTKELLKTAASWQVNRISMGIQSLEDKVLSCVGRCCTGTKARKALALLADSGMDFCTDFIAGLPGQEKNDLLSALQEVIAYHPRHISLYSLTVAEGTKLYHQIESGHLDWMPEAADNQWLAGRDLLETEGYIQYEVSNFAPPGQESRHNSAYWKQKSYLGVGAGAAGTLYRFGGKGRLLEGFRYTNIHDTEKYIHFWTKTNAGERCGKSLNLDFSSGGNSRWKNLCECLQKLPVYGEHLSMETLAFEHLMLGLRMRAGVSNGEYCKRFGKPLDTTAFERFCRQGWMEERRSGSQVAGYTMTKEGLLFLNVILERLLEC